MIRYWRIYREFFRSSFARELEYRANFFAKILQNGAWILFGLLVVLVLYRNTDSVAGWEQVDALLLVGTVFTSAAIFDLLFRSLLELPGQVRLGQLDFILTKPVDSQFWVSTRKFNFDQVGTFVAGIATLIYAVPRLDSTPVFVDWFGFIVLVGCSVAVFYSLCLSLMSLAIWFVRVDNLWVLSESVLHVARFPLDMYGLGIQRFMLYVVPIGFIATVPARQLIIGFDPPMLVLGIGWAVASLLFARWFWMFALKHYTSASS